MRYNTTITDVQIVFVVLPLSMRLRYCSRNWNRPYVPQARFAMKIMVHTTVTIRPIGNIASFCPGTVNLMLLFANAVAEANALLVIGVPVPEKTPLTKVVMLDESVASMTFPAGFCAVMVIEGINRACNTDLGS